MYKSYIRWVIKNGKKIFKFNLVVLFIILIVFLLFIKELQNNPFLILFPLSYIVYILIIVIYYKKIMQHYDKIEKMYLPKLEK